MSCQALVCTDGQLVDIHSCVFSLPSSIFGHEGEDADEVVYINWLSMVRAGLLGLEFYTPESNSWRQVMPTQRQAVVWKVLCEGRTCWWRHERSACCRCALRSTSASRDGFRFVFRFLQLQRWPLFT